MAGAEEGDLLVLGATSLIGQALLPMLAGQGRSVVCLSRAPPPNRETPGVRWLRANLESDLRDQIPDAAQVLSLSPIWLLPPVLPALAHAGVRRLVAFSSTSAFTKAGSPDPAEREIAARLGASERAVARGCESAGVASTILRPTMIYAEGRDRNVSRLAGLIRRFGVLPIAGRGEGLRQPVHAEDLAAGALAVLPAPQTHGRAYDLPGGETLSYRQMVERIFAGLGRRPRILPIPPALWRIGLAAARPLLPGATAAMGARMAQDLVFDASPARADFDWAPRGFHPRF